MARRTGTEPSLKEAVSRSSCHKRMYLHLQMMSEHELENDPEANSSHGGRDDVGRSPRCGQKPWEEKATISEGTAQLPECYSDWPALVSQSDVGVVCIRIVLTWNYVLLL